MSLLETIVCTNNAGQYRCLALFKQVVFRSAFIECRSYPSSPDKFVHVDPSTSSDKKHVIEASPSKRDDNDPRYITDLRMAFSTVPRPKPKWQDRYMKLLIVGETGQGKTSTWQKEH